MDLLSIGSLNTYLKNFKLQTQWAMKQQTGNYSAKGKTLDEWLDSTMKKTQEAAGVQAQVDAQRESGDDTLRQIHAKLDAGGKLTPKEREYLQKNDPEAYQELVNEEREQRAYEQALRRCRTQEEARRLQMTRVAASLTVVKSIEHNPNIPLAKKLKIAMAEKRKVDAAAESTRRFMQSGEFQKLPTQAEEAQVNRDKLEIRPPQKGEGLQRPQGPKEEELAGPGREESRAEAETPEERKVRRAKAKAAYTAMTPPAREATPAPAPTFEGKA